ncbi:MAG: nucleotide exchange factor GrpE [Candidatus Pacebacteria bacterium]|nr:nucleotide exchange factor GrpE [Candidatus Paceibacterota bacterium]
MEENNKQTNNQKPIVDNNEIEERLKKCEQEKEEYLNGWKRAKADYINFQKDEMKRLAEAIKYGNEELIKELLPALDSFDLAIASNNDEHFKKGMEIIYSQFEKILSKQGLEQIKSTGEKFDPSVHEAVMEIESDKEPGTIVEEMVKGWKLNEKVIRPAKVKVAKQK